MKHLVCKITSPVDISGQRQCWLLQPQGATMPWGPHHQRLSLEASEPRSSTPIVSWNLAIWQALLCRKPGRWQSFMTFWPAPHLESHQESARGSRAKCGRPLRFGKSARWPGSPTGDPGQLGSLQESASSPG